MFGASDAMAYGRRMYGRSRRPRRRSVRSMGKGRYKVGKGRYGDGGYRRKTVTTRALPRAARNEPVQTIRDVSRILHHKLPHLESGTFNDFMAPIRSVAHRMVSAIELQPADETFITNIFLMELNNVHDPFKSLGSSFPAGVEVMKAQYKQYLVTKCEWKLRYRNFYWHQLADEEQGRNWAVVQQGLGSTFKSEITLGDKDERDHVIAVENMRAKADGRNHSYYIKRLPPPKWQNTPGSVTVTEDNDNFMTPGTVTISGVWYCGKQHVDHHSDPGTVSTQPPDFTCQRWVGASGVNPVNPANLMFLASKDTAYETTTHDNKVKVDIDVVFHTTWFDPVALDYGQGS